jgi:hypothetical protein
MLSVSYMALYTVRRFTNTAIPTLLLPVRALTIQILSHCLTTSSLIQERRVHLGKITRPPRGAKLIGGPQILRKMLNSKHCCNSMVIMD